MLDFSQNGFNMILDTTDDGMILLKELSCNAAADGRKKSPYWCNLAEFLISGENGAEHHFAKHMGSSGCIGVKYISHKYYENEKGNKLEVLLSDQKVELTVHYQFYTGISAIRAWSVIKNISSSPIGLEYLSSFAYTGFDDGKLPLDEKIRVYIPHSAWYKEANWKKYTLSELGYERCSAISWKRIQAMNTGTWSSKDYLPMGALENLETENAYLWQIENNGSWQWEISDADNMMYFRLSGPTENENGWYKELLPGESFESVKAAVALGKDLNAAIAQMTLYRRQIVNKSEADGCLPVIFNDYMNCIWANPTEEKILPMLDRAAEIGAEYYCMDAGWYDDGAWWDKVGEWMPSEKRFPHGIKYVFDYAREKGLIPGLWLEIESMGVNCPLAKVFDDDCFFVRHGKRVIDRQRYQLDFRNERVRDYASAVIDRVYGEYGVRYIKNDYNIDIGIGTEIRSDSFGDGLLEHCRAFILWVDEIKKKYPDLIWENCSSGGMRMDYAMLSISDLQSTSDQTEYAITSHIAAAAATAVLPEQAAVWAYPRARDTESAFTVNMVNAMMLRVHLSGEIFAWNEEQIKTVKEAISCYKSIRSEISGSVPFYPLGIPQYDDKYFCAGYRSDKAVRIAVWRMDSENETLSIPLDDDVNTLSVIYPKKQSAKAEKTSCGINVTLPEKFSAVIVELT